jgi:hypothetical protein
MAVSGKTWRMATKSTKGNSDWMRRLGLTRDEIKELEKRAASNERSVAAEIRLAVRGYLA